MTLSVVAELVSRPRAPFMPHAGFAFMWDVAGFRAYAVDRDRHGVRLLAEWEHELGDHVVASMVDTEPSTVLRFLRADDRANRRQRDPEQSRPRRQSRRSQRRRQA